LSTDRYDIVVALNYYAPYVSGVTEAARVTAEGLVARGWRVLVVAGRHDRSTPRKERINGVDVIRTRVALTIGKGIVSPGFVPTVLKWGRQARIVHVHAPMLEAGLIAAGLPARVPLAVTYQCDVTLPDSAFNRFQMRVLDRSHTVALRRAEAVLVTSEDYARTSRIWEAMQGRTIAIPAPSLDRSGGEATFRDGDGLHVGFLGRIVEEKGLEYLVEGFRQLGPDARLLIGGEFAKVAGGSVVDKVRRAIDGDSRVRMLGFVAEEDIPDFYASLDVFALTSVNSLEAFGIVQVEAMMTGVPVIASDLPGVRVPVQLTGFGRVVPPRDPDAIAAALVELEEAHLDRRQGAAIARAHYLADRIIEEHDQLFRKLQLHA
jgi:glycosyltransferase involved in cell wall biosynthesis